MKKVLILLFSLFFCLSVQAKDPPKKYLDNNYAFKHHEFIKWPEKTGVWGKIETHGRIAPNSWNLRYETEIVRDGKYSLRFEMRDSDCHRGDCGRKNKAGRSEVSFTGSFPKNTKGHLGNVWYAWSLYIPKETHHIDPAYTILGQFKMPNDYVKQLNRNDSSGFDEDCPEIPLLFHFKGEGILLTKDGVLKCGDHERKIILPYRQIHNKWHDFLLNVNWTDKEDGHIDLWINDKKVYQSKGKTIGKIIKRKKDGNKMGPTYRFGIYNGKRFRSVKTQVIYYDAFKSGKNCKKTALFHDCKNLPN
jgi:hypothetical protein